jgi:hypothetical protein
VTIAELPVEARQMLEQFIDLVEVCIRDVCSDDLDRHKNCSADTIDSIEEFRARVMQRLLAQETLHPSLRRREKLLSMAIEKQTEEFADLWKCPDCGATLKRESAIQ